MMAVQMMVTESFSPLKFFYEVDFLQASRLVYHAQFMNGDTPLPLLKKRKYDYEGLPSHQRPPVRIYGGPSGCLIASPTNYMLKYVPRRRKVHVMRIFEVHWSCSELSWLGHIHELQTLVDQNAIFRINAFPKAITDSILDILEQHLNAKVAVKGWTHMLNVVLVPAQGLGPVWEGNNWRSGRRGRGPSNPGGAEFAPCWVGVVTKEKYDATHNLETKYTLGSLLSQPGELPVSRAYLKMEEIFESFLGKDGKWTLPTKADECNAIDIGSAPGGWSQVLSARCRAVLAVDPGEMKARRGNLLHVRAVAESPESAQAMEKIGQFHICVCDMNTWPAYSAQLIKKHVLRHLAPGCMLILTFKLPRRCSEGRIQRFAEDVQDVFTSGGTEHQHKQHLVLVHKKVLWLHSNTIHERTLLAKFGSV